MAIRRNSDKSKNIEPSKNILPIDSTSEKDLSITSEKINQYEIEKQIIKSKAGFPQTELLEAGGIQQWIQLRTEQLLDDSNENRMHGGLSQLLGLSVGVGAFALTGTAVAPLAPIAIALGLFGYAASVADSAMNLKRILPIPFSGFTLQKLAVSTSADAREELSGYDDTDPDRYNKLAFLPAEKAKELEMIIDYQGMLLEILDNVPEGKRFAIYYTLRQAAIEGGFGNNPKAIASEINKLKDKTKIDSTLDTELIEHIKCQITPIEDESILESIQPKTFAEKLAYRLPMEEVRREELLEDSKHKPDEMIPKLVENLGNTVICSPGGGGKGIVVSNALREVKRQYPDVHIFYIDPKGSNKETGYFDNCTDTLLRYKSLGKSTGKCIEAYEKMWSEFYKLVDEGKRVLLVIDEATTLGNNYGLAGKADLLKKRISELPSLGGDSGLKTWIICQNPHVKDLGINTGVLNQFAKLAILTTKDGTAPGIFNMMTTTTKFIPNKKYVWDDVKVLCDESKVDRAFYYSKFDEWLPMPELTNYSGYDRDTDTFINNQNTVIQSEQPTVIQDEKQQIKLIIDELKKSNFDDLIEAIKSVQPDLSIEEIETIKAKMINTAVMTMDENFLTKFKIVSN